MAQSRIPDHFAYELDAKAEERPDFEVMTFENDAYPDEVLTYADIVLKGRRLARALTDHGIGKGDVFSLVMRNHPEFVYSLYAGALLGAIMLPIDPRTKGDRLKYLLTDSKSKGLIFTSEFMQNVEEVLPGLAGVQIVGVAHKDAMESPVPDKFPSINEILSGPEVFPPARRNEDLKIPLEILYTSGTTGDPKGVMMTQTRLAGFSRLAKLVFQYQDDEKPYTGLSLTHGNAQAVTLVPSLLLGLPSVFSRKFTKSRIWDICRKYECTTFSLLGGMMMGIYSEPPHQDDADNPVRVVLSAGTPIAIWESFEKRFGVLIHEWYGAVEGGFAHKAPGVGPIGSFGKPLDGMMEMKVFREDGTECRPHEVGEIACRLIGQKTEVEYFGRKKASEEKTRGGWLRMGDMGHVDEHGWFFFDYRKGGGLRRSGDFIQPEHVAAAIAEHPDITDVCVYGIPASSGAPGESDLVAALVATESCTVDPRSVFRMFIHKLDGNAVPSYLQVVDAIPKTASEKNLDRLLREEFRKEAPNVFKLEDFK